MKEHLKTSMEELDRLNPNEFKNAEKLPVVVVLDNIRSQSNTGSFFRTCDAFRIKKIYLCGITATPPHREIQKTALGATETVDWEYSETTVKCLDHLKKEGYTLMAVEQTASSTKLDDLQTKHLHPIALIFGNELDGVDQAVIDQCDQAIEIPQSGTKHSLNVSVAGGIVLWEIYKALYEQL